MLEILLTDKRMDTGENITFPVELSTEFRCKMLHCVPVLIVFS